MFGTCKLCHHESELQESHIIPKFVFKWMKRTGTGYLRQASKPNTRHQDGTKEYLLCRDCEAKFNTAETYFSENIFYPYLNDNKNIFDYDERLFYFLISVVWRVLLTHLRDKSFKKHQFYRQLREVDLEWKQFLLGGTLRQYTQIHLLLADLSADTVQPVVNLNRYFNRTVDGTIVSNPTECFVYAKFSKFFIFAPITPFNEAKWINTNITNGVDRLQCPQTIKDDAVGGFLIERAQIANQTYTSQLTTKSKEFLTKSYQGKRDTFIKTDYGKALQADVNAIIEPKLIRQKKVGRNEKCPCGSGKKYKYCHGAT